MMTERVYVVVDAGLSRGAQAAQAIHAVASLIQGHPQWAAEWMGNSNVIIVLEADDVQDVRNRFMRLQKSLFGEVYLGLAEFREPDFDNAFTAFAVFSDAEDEPAHNIYGRVGVLLSDLRLAGSYRRWPWDEWRKQKHERKLRGREPGTL